MAGSLGVTESSSSEPKTMADLEALALADQAARKSGGTAVTGFVRAKETEPVHKPMQPEDSEMGTAAAANPDEIVIDEDDSSDEEEESEEEDQDQSVTEAAATSTKNLKLKDVQKVSVPDAVFGSLKKSVVEDDEEETRALGAKERLLLSKRKR